MRLSKWGNYIDEHLFFDHDGFFELPYLSNQPQLMVDSVIAIPVSNHLLAEQAIYTDNPFTKGVMRYRKIEEGLWLLASQLDVKQNIISKALYNADEESDYYFLSFAVFEYPFPTGHSPADVATLISTTCTFYKPKTAVTTFFYEGTSGKFFNLVFNKQWAEKNLLFKTLPEKKEMQDFLNTETGFINWLDIVPDAHQLSKSMWSRLQEEKDGVFDTIDLKKQMLKIITDFFNNAFADKRIKDYVPLNDPDYANVATAEKLILNNLTAPFLGVENIARAVNLSPTKLKMIFKSVFGFSMLQYHKEKNMLLAMQLIQRSGMQIKNIAAVTGYLSASKFSATFKKRFGVLPAAIRRN
ncbi:helix-turn-helix domain-containing protein [Ferruginibacter sp.]|nr:helix-turn-helix transcriptional regulator [Ferruginibacter sp.]